MLSLVTFLYRLPIAPPHGSSRIAEKTCPLYPKQHEHNIVNLMSEDIRYYKGKFKVKVLSESRGNWIVEALEPFEDTFQGEKVTVKVGERRIVAPNLLFIREGLPPPVKEHTYELKMEKKLKHYIDEAEKKQVDKK